jgi:hypothetical protein
MPKLLKQHRFAYLILFLALASFAFFFSRFWPNKILQRYLAVGMGIFYFFWGVITHVKSTKITSEIVFEYLAISMLAVLLLILITL